MENSDYYYRKYKKYKMLYKKVGGAQTDIIGRTKLLQTKLENILDKIETIESNNSRAETITEKELNDLEELVEKESELNNDNTNYISEVETVIQAFLKKTITMIKEELPQSKMLDQDDRKNLDIEVSEDRKLMNALKGDARGMQPGKRRSKLMIRIETFEDEMNSAIMEKKQIDKDIQLLIKIKPILTKIAVKIKEIGKKIK